MSRRVWPVVGVCVLVSFTAGCGRGLKHEAHATLLEAAWAGDSEDV